MIPNKVSSKYAGSLLEIAFEKKSDEILTQEIDDILEIFNSNSQLRRIIENPVVKKEIKLKILQDIFLNKISKELFDFLTFVINKNRDELLYDILQRFSELRDRSLGIVKVDLTASIEFDDNQVADLKSKLEHMLNKKVFFSFRLDKSIIGGFVARVGDTIIDASLKNQLNSIRKQFLKSGSALN
jgi:F-type H+-transporting ATPase subunit delta